MKTNATRVVVIRIVLFVLLSLYFLTVFSQPDYSFTGGTRIAGTDKQVGAVYRFSNVKTGVDATVTIAAISSGITVVDIDAGSGYNEALQPTLRVQAYTNGYLEMNFAFFVAGTSTPFSVPVLPVTCIDVDGTKNNDGANNPLYEFDEVNIGAGGTIDFTTFGGELMISQSGNWFIGKNTGGIDYPGRDTTAKVVMFTVENTNVSSFTIRVGVDNQSGSQADRLRSVYFKRFLYSHFPLPLPAILDFNGNKTDDKVKLNWKMEAGGEWSKCVLERAEADGSFKTVAVFLPADVTATDYSYTDKLITAGNYYYRLKLTGLKGEIKYSSILAFKNNAETTVSKMQVYPTVVQSQFTVKYRADESERNALLQAVDYTGKIVFSKSLNLRNGDNNIAVNDFSAGKGNFVIVIRSANKVHTQKIIVQ